MTLYVCGTCRRHHRDEGDGSCPFCAAQRPSLRNAWVPLAAAIALAGCHQEDDGRRAVAVYGGPTPPPALSADAGFDYVRRHNTPAYGLAPDHRLTGAPDGGAPDDGAPTTPPRRPDGGRR
jgi:hypothetical protein